MEYSGKRLIALDMDGTLLTSDKRILPETVTDMQAASDAGKYVCLCTGRGIPEIREYRKELAPVRYAVLESGALVYDLAEKTVIAEEKIPRETVEKIVAVGRKYDGMLHFHCPSDCVIQRDQAERIEEYGMGVFKEMFLSVGTFVEDMEQEAKRHASIPKINIYFRSAKDREKGYEELKGLPLTFALAEETSLEMTPKGVSKGTGLKKLAAHLGIDINDVIAVGDADNDRIMLGTAGFSVAMGNALEDLKASVDAVTADNDHNGVGEAIRRYLL